MAVNGEVPCCTVIAYRATMIQSNLFRVIYLINSGLICLGQGGLRSMSVLGS